ncbi:MAG: DUF1573 domain-containing protein [Bacteroidales bacterium]|nr:DUF1573 domain-containing protein [Bacteroidales bacterium]
MNKLLTILFVFTMLSIGITAQNADVSEIKSKELKTGVQKLPYSWDTTLVDLGEIPFKTKKVAEYTLTNTGNQPLFIVYGQASCGCAHLDYSEAPVLPGKSTKVKVTYHGTDPGDFMKTISIVTNADTDRSILQVKGTVLGN